LKVSSILEKVDGGSRARTEDRFYQEEKGGDEGGRLYSREFWEKGREKKEEKKDWYRDDGSGFEMNLQSDCSFPCWGCGEKEKNKKMDSKTKRVSQEEGIPLVLGKDS